MGGSWPSIFNYSAQTKGGFLGNLRMCHHKRNQTMGNRDSIAAATASMTKHILKTWKEVTTWKEDMERSPFLGKKGHNSSHQRRAIKVLLLIICHSTTK